MATLDTTPIRELTDIELRKRLLALGYDVPVSVNREFLVRKLENASAGGGSGGGGKANKRHSMAVTPSRTTASNNSPSMARKRKSIAVTPASNSTNNITGGRGHSHHNDVNLSTPLSPIATSSPLSPGTPQQYIGSPSSISIATPTTPSPFVSRLNTPSPSASPLMHNGETGSHSPRYMTYYNMFKASPTGGGGDGLGNVDMSGNYGYAYNRGMRMSAPPGSFNPVTSVAPPSRSSTERNGYTTGGGSNNASLGVESDWCGGHLVSKILVFSFVLFFMVIGGLYLSKNMSADPRGLTAAGNEGDRIVTPPQPPPTPPPEKKKVDPQPPLTTMVYPVCGLKGVDPQACIPKEVVKNSRTLFNALKEELTQRARKLGCYSGIKDVVSLQDAKTILYKLTDLRKTDVDLAFDGMLLLVTENPRGGLSLHGQDKQEISSKDVSTLDAVLTEISATGINPDFICGVKAIFFSFTMYLTIAAGIISAGFFGWKGYKLYKTKKESEQDEIFKMIERILELLYRQYEISENSQGPAYLAVNHVRDELVPPKERLKKEAFWNKVVEYISNHESRVREEIQHISGEEFKVWRWLPSASPLASKRFSTVNSQHRSHFSMPGSPLMSSSPVVPASPVIAGPSHANMSPASPTQQHNLYPSLSGLTNNGDEDDDLIGGGNRDTNSNNKWQGQAFETCEGSPNALPIIPTTCLKIRHMFTDRDATKERSRIERHILEKCNQAKIMHIGIDFNSVEGCVYIRCLTKDDARTAFKALHGWWFEGKLLSVKFLREERYFNRFPEARNNTVPLGLPR